jgi:membrane protein DedA with SNARE-associated domain
LVLKTSLASMLLWAGHAPLLQATAVVLGTFILEDATTVGTAMAVQDGRIAMATGRLASQVAWARRLIPAPRAQHARTWLEQHVFRTVFAARFMPGVRLPTYTACGFLHASLARFALAAGGATLIWTTLLFGLSLRIGALLMHYMGAWRWAGAIGFMLAVVVAGRLTAHLANARE